MNDLQNESNHFPFNLESPKLGNMPAGHADNAFYNPFSDGSPYASPKGIEENSQNSGTQAVLTLYEFHFHSIN